jgi:hypothetical protein
VFGQVQISVYENSTDTKHMPFAGFEGAVPWGFGLSFDFDHDFDFDFETRTAGYFSGINPSDGSALL